MTSKTAFVFALVALPFSGCTKKEVEAENEKPEEMHDDKTVTLTKEQMEHAEIKVESAELGSLDVTLKATGRVSENMNKTAKVTSTLEGRITKLNFDINDPVEEGDILALIQTPELVGKALEVKAPAAGVIVERRNAVGELVEKTNAIYTISDPKDLWVLAEIKEVDIGAVKVGQDATFTVLPYPGEAFHGQVVRIANQVEADSRTVEARIEVNNVRRRTLRLAWLLHDKMPG